MSNEMSRWEKFLCNILGWHKPHSFKSFDGASVTSVCVRCGRKILQDSQGNWFSIGK